MKNQKNAIIGIYKITNPKSKPYIGQSIDFDNRMTFYKRLDCKGQPKIYNSLKFYGPENHTFELIEECPESYLDELETWWKLFYNSVEDGLNCDYWDKTPRRGQHLSESTKRKIGDKNRGKIYSQESRDKISLAKKGKKQSEETCLKKRKPKLNKGECGKNKPIGFGLKVSKRLKGKKQSKETCLKKSNSMKGKITKPLIPIIQYDLEGNFIKEWEGICKAKKFIKGDIQACCNSKQKTAGGFKWKYKNK